MTPLLNAGVYYLVFGLLLGTRHGTPNFIPYLCTGVFVFNFTQTSVLSGTRAISDNLGLIRRRREAHGEDAGWISDIERHLTGAAESTRAKPSSPAGS